MTRDRDDLRRLHFINALFAHVTGHNLYLAKQIKAAITFSLAELESQTAAHPEFAAKYDAAFNAAADALALAGIRLRYPGASEREQFLRLACLKLGRDLAKQAYPEIEQLDER